MSALVPVWVPETTPGWRAYDEPADYCRCRWMMPNRKACGKPGVADVLRGTKQRWSYCPDHLFGRRWIAGRLWVTHLRPVDGTLPLLAAAASLAADLVEMDRSTAIELETWPAATALIDRLGVIA